MEALRKGGCDILQGYLFSKPVPAEQATHFLRNRQLAPSASLRHLKTAV
jgi:EAL domain-containing protein (putative c-di-GMP-specific phosphodiesterase class I)